MNLPDVHLRRLEEARLHHLPPMFEQVFGHPVSLELLRWKYADGRGESWVAEMAGDTQPLLHCGLAFRDVLVAGECCRAAQLVDLMAGPKRFGLTRGASPFTLLMRSLLDALVRPDNPAALAFGFPSDRAMRLGEHNGVYLAVDRWLALEFTPRRGIPGPRLRQWNPAFAPDRLLANRLWESMAQDFSQAVLGVRDAAYLIRRYCEHPEKRYGLWVVESCWRRVPLGLVVLGPGQGRYEILDLVGRRRDMPDMLLALRRWLHSIGGHALTLLLTEGFAGQLALLAQTVSPTEFRIMANPCSPEPLLARLRGGWWLTGGDTDYR